MPVFSLKETDTIFSNWSVKIHCRSSPTNAVMDIDLQDEYRQLGHFFDDVESMLEWPDAVLFQINEEVSAWSPAQQLYHILRANGMMLKGIQLICHGHRMADNEGEPNDAGRHLLVHGFIRGKAKAPDAVVPPETVSREDLRDSLARSRRKHAETEAFLPQIPEATGRLPHHILGMLNASEWLRLARLHSEHHHAIIRDIVGEQVGQ